MKGTIFNLLEDMVDEEGGPEAWDDLLARAGVAGGYSSIGDYPDADLMALLSARSSASGRSVWTETRSFGSFALLGLARRYPVFFTPHARTRDFLLTLNDVIHPEVRKLHPAARPPTFGFESAHPDHLTLAYRSQRRLCGFAEGMIRGAATHFGEHVQILHRQCVHDGAEECLLDITFGDLGDAPAPTG